MHRVLGSEEGLVELENRSCRMGEKETILWGKGNEKVAEGRRGQCLVWRKRLGCFKKGTKRDGFEKCSVRGELFLSRSSNRYWPAITSFSLSKDSCSTFL